MKIDLPLRILETAKGRLVTPAEALKAVGMVNVAHVRETLYAMRDRGFLHMRNRSHEPNEHGEVPPGRYAREFKVRTEWGGL